MKYSKEFERDYEWYLKNLDTFNFDGTNTYINKKGLDIIVPNEQGLTAKECFYLYDSQGIIEPCKEPELYKQLLKCKGSVNLHIQMWSQDRAKGLLPLCEFSVRKCEEVYGYSKLNDLFRGKDFETELQLLDWIVEAVEKQKYKYYDNTRNISTN
jgi:hypothetical protein